MNGRTTSVPYYTLYCTVSREGSEKYPPSRRTKTLKILKKRAFTPDMVY
jgi:hypothetical protein